MESKLVRGGGKKQRGWQIIIAPSLKKSKGKKANHPSLRKRCSSIQLVTEMEAVQTFGRKVSLPFLFLK
jgi:hypothetical protein